MEQKIIEAAVSCIEKHGFNSVTVRRIADEAGVNVAAINYYFRSKEQLMDRVMETTLDNAFDWKDLEAYDALPPKRRLAEILKHLAAGAQAFPEITRVHFVTPLLGQWQNGLPSVVRFRAFLERLYEDMVARGMAPGDPLRQALTAAVSAAILGAGLMPELFGGFAGGSLRDPVVRDAFIDRLVDRWL